MCISNTLLASFFLLSYVLRKTGFMTAEQFNNLNDEDKKIALFEAKKITEVFEEPHKVELFQIGELFIESRTTPQTRAKRTIKTFSDGETPAYFSSSTL